MKLGFFTACLPGLPLDNVAAWAASAGFQGLEIAAWPDDPSRPWEASHIDVRGFGPERADVVRRALDAHRLEISALAYYENNLDADVARRERIHAHLRDVIDAAAALGCGLVGTFVGRDVTATVADNRRLAEQVLPPLVDHASARGVRLVIENCPMEGWHPDGYPANLAYSPELWDWVASLGLYLNFDPSHLVRLGIDPVAALAGHADRVLHVQAKDVEIDPAGRTWHSIYGRSLDRASAPWNSGWWRYRAPGLGSVDWRRLVDRLYERGFSGFVSVELEDPVWSGSQDKVKQGLEVARRTLSPLLVG